MNGYKIKFSNKTANILSKW